MAVRVKRLLLPTNVYHARATTTPQLVSLYLRSPEHAHHLATSKFRWAGKEGCCSHSPRGRRPALWEGVRVWAGL